MRKTPAPRPLAPTVIHVLTAVAHRYQPRPILHRDGRRSWHELQLAVMAWLRPRVKPQIKPRIISVDESTKL